MPTQKEQIHEMNRSLDYQRYLDAANGLVSKTFGKQKKLPEPLRSPSLRRQKLTDYIINSMLEAEEADWFFGTTGRDKFLKTFGFDYPWITEFEQQAYQRGEDRREQEGLWGLTDKIGRQKEKKGI